MDSRFRFLHPYITELCGDAERSSEPGEEIPVEAKEAVVSKSITKAKREEGAKNKVAKHYERLPRKAAIAYIRPVP